MRAELYTSCGFIGDPPEVRVDVSGELVHIQLGGQALRVLVSHDTARELAGQLLAALDRGTDR